MIANTTSSKQQQIIGKLGIYLFAISWMVFGIQHYMYAGFVSTLVPPYIPFKIFWVYLTGAAMIAAGISFIINIKAQLAALLLATMLGIFVLLVHIPSLAIHPHVPISWTRAIQDIALMGAALVLSRCLKAAHIGQIIFTIALLILGCQHFTHTDFVTAKVPAYFPGVDMLDCVVAVLIIVSCICILCKWNQQFAGRFLGFFLLIITLLYYVPLLISNAHIGALWTAFMLNIAITGGGFIISAKQ